MNETRIPKSVNQQQRAVVNRYDLNFLQGLLIDRMDKQAAKVAKLEEQLNIEKDKLRYMQMLNVNLHNL